MCISRRCWGGEGGGQKLPQDRIPPFADAAAMAGGGARVLAAGADVLAGGVGVVKEVVSRCRTASRLSRTQQPWQVGHVY